MKAFHWILVALISCLPRSGTAAERPSGYVVTWGRDLLQRSSGGNYSTGVVVIAGEVLSNAVEVSAGGQHALALRIDGTVVGWGGNLAGEAIGFLAPHQHAAIGVVKIKGEVLSGVSAVAAGRWYGESFSLVIQSNRTVIGWGFNREGETAIPGGLTNVFAVAAGAYHGLALKDDGHVVSWGRTGVPPPGLSNIIAVAAGGESGRNVVLKNDGTIADWPVLSADYASHVPKGLSNVTAVAAGSGHCLALKRDGTVFGWGANASGEAFGFPTIADPADPNPNSGGSLVTLNGQVVSNIVAIAAGNEYSLGLTRSGSVVAWGRLRQTSPISVPAGLSNVVAIAAGWEFCLAITTNRIVAERFRPVRVR